jgi:nucleoside-diphosphate-sugar epimerase
MIIGSGLLAKTFAPRFEQTRSVCVYAAGVSNSGCSDALEFERERSRLTEALASSTDVDAFVYFSTCSIGDPAARASHYVRHKLQMEALVSEHPAHIVARLPQIAGHTPNPHTLLNYLHARIARSERFSVWKNATRNIIDVEDVLAIVSRLVELPAERKLTVNVANPVSTPVPDIVAAMEKALDKAAVADWLDEGASYAIDVAKVAPIIAELGLQFDREYIFSVIAKYYR